MKHELKELNDKQKEAVLCTEGPLLILAGAGTGKTRVITNRIAYLIHEKNINPREILAITFTNKAADEMLKRVEEQIGMDAGGIWINTFHVACAQILRIYSHLIGYDNYFSIYDTNDQKKIIKTIRDRMGIDTKQHSEKWFLSYISEAKENLIGPNRFALHASNESNQRQYYKKIVAPVYREYQKELQRNQAFDFDDLIMMTVKLFHREPEILNQFQERFRYISIDEYQDTNIAQFEFVNLLAKKYQKISKHLCSRR